MDDKGYFSTRFTTVLDNTQFSFLVITMRTKGRIEHYLMKNCSDGDSANYNIWLQRSDTTGIAILTWILDKVKAFYTVS